MNGNSVTPLNYSRAQSPAGKAAYSDAELFQVMLQQSVNNMISGASSLMGSDDSGNESSLFGSSGDFVSNYSGSSQISSYGSSGLYGSGQNTSPILEMIARSNLIGKTVEATDPSTGQTVTGKVNSVFYEGGLLLFDVGGVKIPPENLKKISG